MRALAEFIMRGRVQASVVAFVGSFLPILVPLSLAAVGLVTLRRGLQDSLLVLICAIAPVLLRAQSKHELAAGVVVYVTLWCAAIVLRAVRSWPTSLLAATAISLTFWLAMDALTVQGGLVEKLLLGPLEMLAGEQVELSALFGGREFSDGDVAASMAFATALGAVLCLLWARWWQALLYNPGGFRAELHLLRFSRLQGVVVVGLALACTVIGEQYLLWVHLLTLPLLVSGISLAHWLVAERQLGSQTLFLFYIGLVVFMPLFVPMLVVIAFTDSIVDLRRYLRKAHEN